MNLNKLQEWLQASGNDVAYISNPTTIAYFTGYDMEPHERIFALLAFKDSDPFVFVPALNVEEAKNSAWDGDVFGYLDSEDPWAVIADKIKGRTSEYQKWALEKNNLSVAHFQLMHEQFQTQILMAMFQTLLLKFDYTKHQKKLNNYRPPDAKQILLLRLVLTQLKLV